MAFLKTKDLKNYTVQGLRSEVRALIKEANRIIYELDESKKAGYMKRIAQDLAESQHINVNKTGEVFTQTKVKYMRKGQLQTLYNELTAFIDADKQSMTYAKRLAGRKNSMRLKTQRTMKKKLTKEEYQTMLDIFDEYEDYMDTYGYSEMVDLIKEKKGASSKNIIFEIDEAVKTLQDSGVIPTAPTVKDNEKYKGTVLTYLGNKEKIQDLMQKENISFEEAVKRISTQ